MRTNVVLDDALVAEAMEITQARTKREVLDLALRELISRKHYRDVIMLRGQGLIDPDYDVREMRRLAGKKLCEKTQERDAR